MTPTWFNSFTRIDALREVAKSWLGTPFFRASCAKGQGVDCSHFVGAVYREVGCCDVSVPDWNVGSSKFSRESLVEPFVRQLGRFAEVATGQRMPGDMLGIKVGRVIHHLGIVIDETRFIHVLNRVTISAISDATWASRIKAVWRPTP